MSRYCNEACQRANWSTHKAFCRLAVKHGLEPRFFDLIRTRTSTRSLADYAAHRDELGDFVSTCCCL